MIRLLDINDSDRVPTGTIIRLYKVQRLDVMKSREDLLDVKKQADDFYNYMVVDANVVLPGVFLLINITLNNPNKGSILHVFENVNSRYYLDAGIIKKYFADNINVYIDIDKKD